MTNPINKYLRSCGVPAGTADQLTDPGLLEQDLDWPSHTVDPLTDENLFNHKKLPDVETILRWINEEEAKAKEEEKP